MCFFWFTFIYNIFRISEVDGIMCVQCSTLVESSEEVCKSGDIPATNCSNSNDTACIKYMGTHNGSESMTCIVSTTYVNSVYVFLFVYSVGLQTEVSVLPQIKLSMK